MLEARDASCHVDQAAFPASTDFAAASANITAEPATRAKVHPPALTAHKIWTYRAILPEAAADFAGDAQLMRCVAGLSLDLHMPQAEAALREHLANLSPQPLPRDRRRSAALFAGAGDPYPALVQWWHLPAVERVAGDGVSLRLAKVLGELGSERNESVSIAARLAVRLGLERIYQTNSQEKPCLRPRKPTILLAPCFRHWSKSSMPIRC
ncbi:MAG: hypothetical protein V2I27_06095 [Erythrobacter sp.]|jgi:hypothetical protein|nr:hypothetical protein [Erythrobacter sp.]